MSPTGQPVGQPLGTASSVIDRSTALHATIGALAALRHRDRTGEGQLVDVCLLDSALTLVEIPTCYYLATGEEGGEGGRPPYRAKDGYVVISAAGREMAARLFNWFPADFERRRADQRRPVRWRRAPGAGSLVRHTAGGNDLLRADGDRCTRGAVRTIPEVAQDPICGNARCW